MELQSQRCLELHQQTGKCILNRHSLSLNHLQTPTCYYFNPVSEPNQTANTNTFTAASWERNRFPLADTFRIIFMRIRTLMNSPNNTDESSPSQRLGWNPQCHSAEGKCWNNFILSNWSWTWMSQVVTSIMIHTHMHTRKHTHTHWQTGPPTPQVRTNSYTNEGKHTHTQAHTHTCPSICINTNPQKKFTPV